MRLFGKLKLHDFLIVPKRYGNSATHWSVIKKKNAAKDKALKHFDDFYQSVYGESWPNIRQALLKEHSKYMAIVNNFGNTEETIEKFELLGAISLQQVYESQLRNISFRNARAKEKLEKESSKDSSSKKIKVENFVEDKQMAALKSLYPTDYDPPQRSLEELKEDEEKRKIDRPLEPVKLRSMEEHLDDSKIDESRIVKPSVGLTSSTLHEYIPATKLKGMDDWLLESEHYGYYSRNVDFSIKVVKDNPVLTIPKHLKVYTFEALNDSKFPQPRPGSVGVYDYYLMDGGSILPVLALDLQPGDTVLDMCAAPGGKSYAALQTLMPRVLVANDVSSSRVRRINDVIDEYFGGLNVWDNRLFVTKSDARSLTEINIYNKIMVDVPCTTDRHILHEDDNNWFKPSRIRERLKLPELQSELLCQALKMIAPGGTVVYSTCSLSPIQNDGVVQMALKKHWEEQTDSTMVVMDMMESLEPLRCLYKFGNFGLKYGHIVIPTKGNNWGPLYFCKIVRVR